MANHLQDELTVGLEEELFLVDKNTTDLCLKWPTNLWQACQKSFPEQIVREFLSGQVELVSSPFASITSLRKEMSELRHCLIKHTEKFELAPMASATHPSAKWRKQIPTPCDRYSRLSDELKISADRMLVCGTHIHIGVSDMKQRLRLYNEMTYFLPIIMSLTTSSPFWAGLDTGLMSYRATILNGLPRAGLPPVFACIEDYQRYLSHMVGAKAIQSGKELWWDLRLSARFPTVELRIGDTCTHLDDLMAVAAFVQSLSRHILHSDPIDKSMLDMRHLCTKENRWRAQRYDISSASFLMPDTPSLKPVKTIIKSMVHVLKPHAEALGCFDALQHCLTICKNGTSADKQKRLYVSALEKGESKKQAIKQVSNYLINETTKLSLNRAILVEEEAVL